MAQIDFFYFTGGSHINQSTASAFRVALGSGWNGSALAFSGASGPNSNITVGEYQGETWVLTNSSSPTVGNSIQNFMWINPNETTTSTRGTACAYNQTSSANGYIDIGNHTSASLIQRSNLSVRFTHASSVKTTPVYIWAGSGATIQNALDACSVKAFDCTKASAAAFNESEGRNWKDIDWNGTNASRLTASAHNVTSVEHWWGFNFSVSPTDVGSRTHNAIKCEITYF